MSQFKLKRQKDPEIKSFHSRKLMYKEIVAISSNSPKVLIKMPI